MVTWCCHSRYRQTCGALVTPQAVAKALDALRNVLLRRATPARSPAAPLSTPTTPTAPAATGASAADAAGAPSAAAGVAPPVAGPPPGPPAPGPSGEVNAEQMAAILHGRDEAVGRATAALPGACS
jgi:hypothetical protein